MDSNLKLFTDALRMIGEKDLAAALELVLPYIKEHPYVQYTEEVDSVDENFRLMVHYMEQGVDDPMREKMYADMLARLKKAVRNIRNDYRRRNIDFYKDANSHVGAGMPMSEKGIRIKLEDFVADVAMLQLEDETTRKEKAKQLYSEHYRFIQSLFCSIVVADLWTEEQAANMQQILLSPTVDTTDVQMIVSAIMLATMNNFDINKFNVLVDIYRNALDGRVRQKALIGWVFSMTSSTDTEEQKQRIASICKNKDMVRELFDFQKQVLFCMNAEQDTATIERDIMPTLIKNSNLNISRFGITEKEDAPMTDILDPGAQDRAMEETEEKFRSIMDMQKAGADVYFGGFSQMKRFSFFYMLPNWFCPFDINHPDLMRRLEKLKDDKAIGNILANGPFCDNDKYSFALALATVIEKLPDGLKEVIGNDEMLGNMTKDEDMTTDAYFRRLSLQDLYRFFRLYKYHDQVYNPFTVNTCLFVTNPLFKGTQVEEQLPEFANFILKRKNASLLGQVVKNMEQLDSQQAYMTRGVYYLDYTGEYEKAEQCFCDVLAKDSTNEQAMLGYAKATFRKGDIKEACLAYSELYADKPDRKTVAMDYSITLIKQRRYEEAAKVLYRLDFTYPDTLNVKRLLAWTMMGLKRLQDAEKLYSEILSRNDNALMDKLNAAYCKWFAKDIDKATALLGSFCKGQLAAEGKKDKMLYLDVTRLLEKEFSNDREMLDAYDISLTDRMIIRKMTFDRIFKD